MSDHDESPETEYGHAVGELVESVHAVGERARFLAVNLAVIAAKLKQEGTSSARLNDDILDLVARITRVSQEVNDALEAMEKGQANIEKSSPSLWHGWQSTGIPDEKTLARLEGSLQETLELSRHIFRWIKEVQPEPEPQHRRHKAPPRSHGG
ncbi:MAG: hypothetical protein GF341_03405 [candidate division Zixibacteria bacterium]|nr:hypothetical protein [candidate division Zixibacteria bacterium]